MPTLPCIGPDECRGLKPRMFAVNHAAGEKLSDAIRQWLDPIQMDSFHAWMVKREQATALHYHDHDEYWAWVKGRSLLTLRLPDGQQEQFEIGPGWIVYCVRGIEHGHTPLEDWGCFEWTGTMRPRARSGHLVRQI